MKFFIINTDYQDFIEQDYKLHNNLKNQSFAEQLNHRWQTLFGVNNFYSENLKKLGHQAVDIIANHQYIQRQWAREKNIYRYSLYNLLAEQRFFKRYFKSHLLEKILFAQIMEYKPDIIYNMAMETVTSDFLNKVKKQLNIFITGQHAAPIVDTMNDLSAYDLIFSSLPNLITYFKQKNVPAEYLPLAFGGQPILNRLKKISQQNQLIFIGGISGEHERGTKILEALAKEFVNFKIWGYGLNNLSKDSFIRKRHQGYPLFGFAMYQEIFNSQIVINRHIDLSENYANNMRLYETTGVGSFLITDDKANLKELFEPQKEIETYQEIDQLIEKIKYYLKHETERQGLAKAGQQRTLQWHTYEIRMKEMLDILARYY